MGFERNYQIKIPSKQLNYNVNKFSTFNYSSPVNLNSSHLNSNLSYVNSSSHINPYNSIGAGLFVRSYSSLLTNVQKNSYSVSPDLHEIIIGLSLGDLYIRKPSRNALLMFEQGLIHEAYILHLYDLFKDYCSLGPKNSQRKPDFRTGKIYSRVTFYTYSLPCFNYYHELFYVNGVKRIPLNIGELLTARSLAYWLMDDSYKHSSGLSMCTESYSEQEVLLLVSVLKEKFNIDCNPMKRNSNKFRIYIKSKSLNELRKLVSPYFIPSMMYKISEENIDNDENLS
jgi:hypothetical protein